MSPDDGAGSGNGSGSPASPAGGGNGGAGNPWHHGIDAELIGHWQNKGYDLGDPAKIAIEATKAARAAERHLGVSADQILRLPKDANDEAGWNGVWRKLGVPEMPEEYDFSSIKHSNGEALDPAFVDTMRAGLLAARVPKDKAAEIIKAAVRFTDDGDMADSIEFNAKLDAERATLKRDWGQNFEYNRLKAMEGARRAGVDPATVAMIEKQIGYSKVMELFRKIGTGTSESTFVDGSRVTPDGLPATREGAKAVQKDKFNDPAWVKRLFDKDPQTLREFQNLSKLTTGYDENS